MKTLKLSAAALLILTIVSCGTLTPLKPKAKQASFDGGIQNSGFLGFTTNGFAVLSPHKMAQYNNLSATYGPRFHPPLIPGEGTAPFTNGTYLIDKQHLHHLMQMIDWSNDGVK